MSGHFGRMLLTRLVQSLGALALAQVVLGDANQMYRRTNETTDELDSGAAVGLEDEQTYHVDTECPHHCKEKIYITVTYDFKLF